MLVMLDFLDEIRRTGKIASAADKVHLSYRHSWNLIEKWSAFFGTPLVERERGRGTRLTEFGDRLVWADQRLRARLEPQLQNLAQELETEINGLLPVAPAAIRIHASHGFAVSKLREMLTRGCEVRVDLRYVDNKGALSALARGCCDLAAVHLPRGPLREAAVNAVKEQIDPDAHSVIGFVTREMGLIVRPGNPHNITTIEHLAEPGVRFVNRDPASGTRFLLEQMMVTHGIDTSAICGYERTELTHSAVAAYVASGMADVGFGAEAAARLFDLDFVRLVTEDYFFVCTKSVLQSDQGKRIIAAMASDEFRSDISALPGYAPRFCGSVKSVEDALRDPV